MTPAQLACAGQWQHCVDSIDGNGSMGNVNDGNTVRSAASHLCAQAHEPLTPTACTLLVQDDSSGFTALHYAVVWGPSEFVPLLISKGADVNARTTAIEVCARGHQLTLPDHAL